MPDDMLTVEEIVLMAVVFATQTQGFWFVAALEGSIIMQKTARIVITDIDRLNEQQKFENLLSKYPL